MPPGKRKWLLQGLERKERQADPAESKILTLSSVCPWTWQGWRRAIGIFFLHQCPCHRAEWQPGDARRSPAAFLCTAGGQ